jgi:hypothetical protein
MSNAYSRRAVLGQPENPRFEADVTTKTQMAGANPAIT